jgi:hypothetical protein
MPKVLKMNDLSLNATCTTAVTMTLKEITDLLDVRHNDAVSVVERMSADSGFGTCTKISYMLTIGNNAKRAMETYQLNKRQSIAVAANLNTALLMRIIDRWQELESRQTLDAERIASDMIARGMLPGMIGWWQEQLNGGYHGENNWNITPKSSVSELQYSFRNYCQRHDLYGIPTGRGYGYFFSTNQFKISLKEVSGVWSTKELKFHSVEDLKSRFESKRVDLCLLCV